MRSFVQNRHDDTTRVNTISPEKHAKHVLCRDISRDLVDHFKWYLLNCQDVFNVFSFQSNLEESMSNIVIMAVSACGLAPLGARISANIVINKIGACIYTGPALEGIRSFFLFYLITWKLISLYNDFDAPILSRPRYSPKLPLCFTC